MHATSRQLIRWIGFAAGLALAALILFSGRLPAEGRPTGAMASMLTQPPDELAITPIGVRFLDARDLRPGNSAQASVEIRNLLQERLWVSMLAKPANHDLDVPLHVEIRTGGRRVFIGTLSELREWTAGFALRSRQLTTVEFRVFIPAGAPHGYEGRSTPIEIAWQAERKAR
jgi:hypothetical protein